MADAPAKFLERVVQQRVTLALKDGRTMSGRLLGIDEHMNLVLEDADEVGPEMTRHLGRVVVRGSNVITLHAPPAPSGRPSP